MNSRNVHKERDFSIERLTGNKETCVEDRGTDMMEDEDPNKKYPDYCRTITVTDANGTVKELVFPKALDLDRPKRARTTFSAEQLYHLEREFQRNQYLVGRERTDLASRMQLSETQVKVWFQNRRTKYKRDKTRENEEHKANAESMAACNILQILQQQPAPNPTASAPPSHPPAPTLPHHHHHHHHHHLQHPLPPYLQHSTSMALPRHPGFYST